MQPQEGDTIDVWFSCGAASAVALQEAGYAAEGMSYFERLAANCDLLAFMRFPDGSIGAGVGKEIRAAQDAGVRWIIEYFDGQCYPVYGDPTPVLSIDATRALIAKLRATLTHP